MNGFFDYKRYALDAVLDSPSALVFDIETDGLLSELTKLHCGVTTSLSCGTRSRYTDAGVLVKALKRADYIIGHNIIDFDIPALEKLTGQKLQPEDPRLIGTPGYPIVVDTLVISRHFHPTIFDKADFPKKLKGKYSLKAWGVRLGFEKGSLEAVDEDGNEINVWERFTPEMMDYCERDVDVTVQLFLKLRRKKLQSPKAIWLEHRITEVISRQTRFGVYFNVDKAEEFAMKLRDLRQPLLDKLRAKFGKVVGKKHGWFTPKSSNRKFGYVKGQPIWREDLHDFNPNSPKQIIEKLQEFYPEWVPEAFTDSGAISVNKDALEDMAHWCPEAAILFEYADYKARLSALTAKNGWLNCVEQDGRIHGFINPQGAITGRMTHSKPNTANIPKCAKPFGRECRELFCAPPGRKITGADAAQLEYAMLAHHLARFDGGRMIRIVLEGDKEDGTDIHTLNMQNMGVPTRDMGKTIGYAMMYGGGANQVMKKYRMSTSALHKAIVAPYRNQSGKTVGYHMRHNGKQFSWTCKIDGLQLFGQHLWKQGGRTLVITEGEFDCVAGCDATAEVIPFVSIPSGTQSAVRAITDNIEFIESFDKVILWFDDDEPGHEALEKCVAVLTPGKVYKVCMPTGYKDCCQMFEDGLLNEIRACIKNAQEVRPDGLLNGADCWDKFIEPVPEGVYIDWLPELCKATHGMRKGEMTLVGAGSGAGKTTFMHALAYDLLMKHGCKVGIIALEDIVRDTFNRLLGHHLCDPDLHFTREKYTETELRSAFDEVTDSGRLMVNDGFGSMKPSEIHKRMMYMAKGFGADFIIFDHITIAVSGDNGGESERRVIDQILTTMQTLVKQTGVGFIMASQFSNPSMGKTWEEGRVAKLSDFRGSGSLAFTPDIIVAASRNQWADDPDDRRTVQYHLLKGRWGGSDPTVDRLIFDRSIMQYYPRNDGTGFNFEE